MKGQCELWRPNTVPVLDCCLRGSSKPLAGFRSLASRLFMKSVSLYRDRSINGY